MSFLTIAAGGLAWTALTLFRYEKSYNYASVSELSTDTNWFGLATSIKYYGSLVLFGFGFVTQLLDLFCIGTYINFLTWGWALGTIGMLASGVANAMLYWQYDRNYACSVDSKDNTKKTNCKGANDVYTSYILNWFVLETAIWATINQNVHSWIAGQWKGLPKDYKEKKRHDLAKFYDRKDGKNMLALFDF
jgi:hypothetical protein